MHWTNNPNTAKDSLDSPAPVEGTGAPEAEIEITTEMIEAGRDVLSTFNQEFDIAEDFVAEIYRAMEAKKLKRDSV
ncbi:MAG: hypothetical protein ACREDM_02860 [Methylocella sp.]